MEPRASFMIGKQSLSYTSPARAEFWTISTIERHSKSVMTLRDFL
jgi:hypothetical protein